MRADFWHDAVIFTGFIKEIMTESAAAPEEGRRPAGLGVIVMGASSQISRSLLPRLTAAGYTVQATARGASPAYPPVSAYHSWHRVDYAARTITPPLDRADILIHLAPLPTLPPLFETVGRAGVSRIIAFSSTSRFTKTGSSDPGEQALALRLAAAEDWLAKTGTDQHIAWTLFRPTLVYGYGVDKNVSTIAGLIAKFGFFPLAGAGRGLRQPVHVDDLAAACMAALHNPATYGKRYNLSGGETLSYRAMVERIFQALDRRPRFILLPVTVYRGLLALISRAPRYRYISADMVRRMNEDMVFDHGEASRDFGYAPRPFEPRAALLGVAAD